MGKGWPALDCGRGGTPPDAAAFSKMMGVLDSQGIDFRRHWGKFNALDAARVADDYRDRLPAWKQVRDALLPPDDLKLFRTEVLDDWGLTA